MKSIIAETERNLSSQTSPKDGLSTAKWTPRTPPRPERMPPTPAPPASSSPSKMGDVRITPVTTQGVPAITRPEITSSGLSITRPQGIGPALGVAKSQAQTPPKSLGIKPPLHFPPSPTRTQSSQAAQPITPVKLGAGSPSVRRTS
jgi:hypothetical protein